MLITDVIRPEFNGSFFSIRNSVPPARATGHPETGPEVADAIPDVSNVNNLVSLLY